MITPPETLIEHLRQVHRCQPEIRTIAQEMVALSADYYDSLVVKLAEKGEDHALGILLIAATVNNVVLDPVALANAIKTVDILTDIKYPYNYQSENSIGPLLDVAVSEDISYERKVFAARIAVELAIKFGSSKQPVKKVLWQLREEIFSAEARLLLDITIDLLEKGQDNGGAPLKLLGRDVFSDLPVERPPAVIGDGGTVRRPVAKIGRNEPCRCGSGKKYKKCCYDADQEKMRDSSAYEGVTKSQLRDNPSLVNDASCIEGLRPYELKKLMPSKMNEDQLFAAYRRADIYGLRDIAFEMLLELKGRPGKEKFATEHMCDLFTFALKAGDMKMIPKIAPHIPEEGRYFHESDKLRHELLETPNKFRDLEAMCRKSLVDKESHHLLEISYAFEDILPALSLAFARAAIVSEPERIFDNDILIDAVHTTRIALDMEPWGDPIEDYWEWAIKQNDKRLDDQDKDEEIRRLREQLTATADEGSSAQKNLREKEASLADLEKKLQETISISQNEATGHTVKNVTELSNPVAEEHGEEKRQESTSSGVRSKN